MTLLLAYWKACCAVALVAFMHAEIPTPEGEEDYREALASAIVTASPLDPQEQRQLARLAAYETGLQARLGAPRCACREYECHGARGAFQAQGILCPATIEHDAMIAAMNVRESRRMCAHLPRRDQLAAYCRGVCDSDEGKRLSRVRYSD